MRYQNKNQSADSSCNKGSTEPFWKSRSDSNDMSWYLPTASRSLPSDPMSPSDKVTVHRAEVKTEHAANMIGYRLTRKGHPPLTRVGWCFVQTRNRWLARCQLGSTACDDAVQKATLLL
jgi:hypothetical protein